jgi:hypothetical protein
MYARRRGAENRTLGGIFLHQPVEESCFPSAADEIHQRVRPKGEML